MAIPVIKGQKTNKEKFAGAMSTYSVESIMYDGKALQTATSHNFGSGFAECYGITYTDRNNEIKHVHQTSWGLSTRTIGALIMVHSDDDGLVVPPKIAPVQVVIVPIAAHTDDRVKTKANELYTALKNRYRTIIDDSDKSPGWKFALHEMRGVALRLEIGPKDLDSGSCIIVRRDNRQKYKVPLDALNDDIQGILDEMQAGMLQSAVESLNAKTYKARSYDEFVKTLTETPGLIMAMWCQERECEEDIKEKTGATSRVIPFEQENLSDTCFNCGKAAVKMVCWGKAY
jgi:prolyl-tRNA synthetase